MRLDGDMLIGEVPEQRTVIFINEIITSHEIISAGRIIELVDVINIIDFQFTLIFIERSDIENQIVVRDADIFIFKVFQYRLFVVDRFNVGCLQITIQDSPFIQESRSMYDVRFVSLINGISRLFTEIIFHDKLSLEHVRQFLIRDVFVSNKNISRSVIETIEHCSVICKVFYSIMFVGRKFTYLVFINIHRTFHLHSSSKFNILFQLYIDIIEQISIFKGTWILYFIISVDFYVTYIIIESFVSVVNQFESVHIIRFDINIIKLLHFLYGSINRNIFRRPRLFFYVSERACYLNIPIIMVHVIIDYRYISVKESVAFSVDMECSFHMCNTSVLQRLVFIYIHVFVCPRIYRYRCISTSLIQ